MADVAVSRKVTIEEHNAKSERHTAVAREQHIETERNNAPKLAAQRETGPIEEQ